MIKNTVGKVARRNEYVLYLKTQVWDFSRVHLVRKDGVLVLEKH